MGGGGEEGRGAERGGQGPHNKHKGGIHAGKRAAAQWQERPMAAGLLPAQCWGSFLPQPLGTEDPAMVTWSNSEMAQEGKWGIYEGPQMDAPRGSPWKPWQARSVPQGTTEVS